MKINKLNREYLSVWPTLATYCEERPGVSVWTLIDDGKCLGALVAEPGRVHHIYVPEEHRQGGYGEMLLSNFTADHREGALRAAVVPDNYPAVKLFLKTGFKIVGFNQGWDCNRYVMEFRSVRLVNMGGFISPIEHDVAGLVRCICPIEVLPVKVRQVNTPT